MEPLIINYKKSDTTKIIRVLLAIYFLCFCGYFTFTEAAVDRYGMLFIMSLVGVLISLLVLLINTLWEVNTKLLVIDQSKIEFNIKPNKFKTDWINVSNVKIYNSSIYLYTNGGKKERIIDLSEIHLKDIAPIKRKFIEICEHKTIAYTNE